MTHMKNRRVYYIFPIFLIFLLILSFERCTKKNTSTKNPSEFNGYSVSPNARQMGIPYWKNLPVPADLYVGAFQKGVKILTGPFGNGKYEYSSWVFGISLGDFNNDGWIDIFNAGAACNGKAANLSFLIWNPTTKIFDEKNLINSGVDSIGGPVRSISMYLNSDNYVDVVIIGHQDECSGSPFENCKIMLSDGLGKYNLSDLQLEPAFLHTMFGYAGGDIGDLNNDNKPDLILASGTHTYIFWGISNFPYFTNQNFAHFASDTINFSSNNGFGEVVPGAAGDVYRAWAVDISNDGKNDLLLGSTEYTNGPPNRFLINLGAGRFNQSSIRNFPLTNIANLERIDYIVDDFNNDGLKDLMALDCIYYQFGNQTLQKWELVPYIQQQNNNFIIDYSWVQYTINTSSRPNSKWYLIYTDYNGDGKKDIGYIDSGVMPTLDPNNDLKKKTIFIRSGNKFIESDFYQYDNYAKSIKEKYF
jgi:hypothetical protein